MVASEAVPFIKSGGLADVLGALPKALGRHRIEARLILPLYGEIRRSPIFEKAEHMVDVSFWLSWRNCNFSLYRVREGATVCYLIENAYYFDREGLYGYFDDGERFAFFSKAVLQAIPYLDFQPDVLHCHDWQSAMVACYRHIQKDIPEKTRNLSTVFTIHNIEYQGNYSSDIVSDVLGLSFIEAAPLEYRGQYNFMKGAIETSHLVTTVSPTYAQEIGEPFFGRGLDPVIRANREKIVGVLNGIDRSRYNPLTDASLPVRFSKARPTGKRRVKAALQEELGLADSDQPLYGMVSRLVRHKGIDLVAQTIEGLLHEGAQFVLLGTGEYHYEEYFRHLAQRHPGKVAVVTAFSEPLASRIYGGSDFFLMPSISEPCGLAQMIALRYGAVPIVRETGGLKDTVFNYDSESGEGNGIRFVWATATEFWKALLHSMDLYYSEADWPKVVQNALATDLSWVGPAAEYNKLYRSLRR